MNRKPIVFFDSGVGGLPYLELAQAKLKLEQFIYVADHKNFPYGNKKISQIKKIVLNSIDSIIKRIGPKVIVIACNTASVVALKDLRDNFNMPFIGVVPAVKPAAGNSKNGRIAILATERTVKDDYLKMLIDNFASSCDVIKVPAKEIVDLVENRFFNTTKKQRLNIIQGALKKIDLKKIDSIVIGCTHFLLVEEEIKQFFGSNIQLVDSRHGVINQLISIMDRYSLRSELKAGKDLFFLTGGPLKRSVENIYRSFSLKYNLIYSGSIS